MKKTLSLAFAMLLAVGSAVQAQDEAPPVPVDAQPSVSDSVVAPQATPVPVAATSVVNGAVASDCVGCGQSVTPQFAQPMVVGYPLSTPVVSTGCSSCQSGCGTVQAPVLVPQTTCGGCGMVAQVSYDQPIYQSVQATAAPAQQAVVVEQPPIEPVAATPAPVVTAQVAPMMSSCCGATPVATNVVSNATPCCGSVAPVGCNNCQRRVFRGRILGRR